MLHEIANRRRSTRRPPSRPTPRTGSFQPSLPAIAPTARAASRQGATAGPVAATAGCSSTHTAIAVCDNANAQPLCSPERESSAGIALGLDVALHRLCHTSGHHRCTSCTCTSVHMHRFGRACADCPAVLLSCSGHAMQMAVAARRKGDKGMHTCAPTHA